MKDETSGSGHAKVEVVPRIADVPADAWDACANPDPSTFNPFVAHAFLKALEDAGTVGGRTGWTPRHLVLKYDAGEIAGCAPCYLKSHSQGEYVFDYGWADAYIQAGGRYYPKLQIAVPFTPVPGPRLLVRPGSASATNEAVLAAAAIEIAERSRLSGVHITFLSEGEWTRLGAQGLLQRTNQQFQWRNTDYATFDDYLGSLASRKRKATRKEREQALAGGLRVEWLRGREITEAHWDKFFQFYTETGSRKWGRPYLNRKFFSLLSASAAGERCVLMFAKRAGRAIGGSFHLVGGDCLFGRYWGAVEHQPFLHFEMCYYQAIDYAIQHKLQRVEAGAQGEHKLARGYLPEKTYSVHHLVDPALRRAVANFLERERRNVDAACEVLAEHGPYRKAPTDQA
ncbi:MAG TPA: GNAT family N-acetyltransferase [Hyphomicrobiaceae bacterium]|jgi:predicted N-acyltransferase|nr:GNAT family N-acetyltransferase [Hyphomicrobiaceae bacterium]